MKAGILKEPDFENRVTLMPESVEVLKKLKVNVLVEKGAGNKAFTADTDYEKVGAKVLLRADVIKEADVLLSINIPDAIEKSGLKENQVLVSIINPFINLNIVKLLVNRNITSFSLDMIPRITRAQSMDVLSSMATIAGYKAVLEAALALPSFFPMFMSAAGTIKPAKVLILGAGIAGLQAIAIARKLGAVVEVFDVRSAVKDEVKSLGGKFIEVEGAVEDKNAGGYAMEQTEGFKKKQAQVIHDHAVKSNVIICTAQIPGKKAPVLIPETTLKHMKQGSVIIDLAASSGGNCELSENGRVIEYNGIRIFGKANYPSEMPVDASKMFGRNVVNFLKLIIDEEGNLKLDFKDDVVKGTCLTHNKEIINERVKDYIMMNRE